jgi:hypothetical protein
MKLMGIDVGFSRKRATTGIACLDGDLLWVECAGTSWKEREAKIPRGFRPSIIALDGPLVPRDADVPIRRSCEAVFVRAPFHNRCKPGLSHSGLGLALRRASADACAQFRCILTCSPLNQGAAVCRNGPVVEAFPNAFLGVLRSECVLLSAQKFKRGRRFDWLYNQTVTTGKLRSVLARTLELPVGVWDRLECETNHERRAALICLQTAALAAQAKATVVGDDEGGWFWLPPWSAWQPWAIEGLEGHHSHPALQVLRLDIDECSL